VWQDEEDPLMKPFDFSSVSDRLARPMGVSFLPVAPTWPCRPVFGYARQRMPIFRGIATAISTSGKKKR
jgi:hypothetical protein